MGRWEGAIFGAAYDAAFRNKYQLSLIDPRDKIVLWTELDDLCDKLVVECRSSEKLST